MPAAFAVFNLSSAAAFVGIEASTTVNALLPGGQPEGAAAAAAGAGAGVGVDVVPLVVGAGVGVDVAGVAAGCEVVGGVSAGALAGAGCVGAAAVVLFALSVTDA